GRGGRRIPREGDRLPGRDGGPRTLSPALPFVRDRRATHRLRRERDQLLPALPDGRADPLRSEPLAPPQGGLAANGCGARGAVRKAVLRVPNRSRIAIEGPGARMPPGP